MLVLFMCSHVLVVRQRSSFDKHPELALLRNARRSANPNTADTNPGLNGSKQSHTKLNLPGFFPSCKKPKLASNPLAITTGVIRAAKIPNRVVEQCLAAIRGMSG